jgi:hypothetical protein
MAARQVLGSRNAGYWGMGILPVHGRRNAGHLNALSVATRQAPAEGYDGNSGSVFGNMENDVEQKRRAKRTKNFTLNMAFPTPLRFFNPFCRTLIKMQPRKEWLRIALSVF